jgi:hypothetical protein
MKSSGIDGFHVVSVSRRGDAVEGGGGERRGVEIFDSAIGRGGERGEGGPRAGRVRGALESVSAPGIADETQARASEGKASDSTTGIGLVTCFIA